MNRLKRLVPAIAAGLLASGAAAAQDVIKIGLIVPMTGPSASTGVQVEAGVRLYQQMHGTTVAGKKIEVILKDDTGTQPELTRRIAQDLVIKDKVNVLAGFGLTPLAVATAPISAQSKTPMVVMAAASSVITTRSPYILRASFTLPQATVGIAEWSAKNGIKKVFTLVADYAPGIESETTFKKVFAENGGQIVGEVRSPLANPDFAPFLQRVKDAKPDALFVFVPSGQGAAVMKQFKDRGLVEDGVRLIGTGDVVDDDQLQEIGAPALGAITSHHYSAAHNSPENKAYVEGMAKLAPNMRPNFMSVGGYDGMHLIYETLKKTNGNAEGDAFMAAAKGLTWTSPRGPVKVEPDTRELTQNIYIRKTEQVNGQYYNIEFDTLPNVKDPAKPAS